MKILAGLGFAVQKIAVVLISVITKIASFLAGPFLVFVIACGIYCAVTANWKSLMILAVIGGALIVLFMLLGLLLGAVDVGLGCAKKRLR